MKNRTVEICVPPLAALGGEDGDMPGVNIDRNVAHELVGDTNGPRVEKERDTHAGNKEIPEMPVNKLINVGGT
jgi:hypothetical protein